MRLLHETDVGAFSVSEHVHMDETPPYAILSHMWSVREDEVTFQDIVDGTGKEKPGYSKICFCARQAQRDGLAYFWVDTCCVDRSSSAELSEAVNSVFRWFQNAKSCYVYLSDVSFEKHTSNSRSLRESRWFTRGWTLPELLAPKVVQFFTTDGKFIGDKISMVTEIHNITGIPISALQGAPLSDFSIDERMSWAKERRTKREEDAAYALLGLFNVYMPLIYGEGAENALSRLRNEIILRNGGDVHQIWGDKANFRVKRQYPADIPKQVHDIPATKIFDAGPNTTSDSDSDDGSEVASVFSDGGASTSSASTASLSPVQTVGIREVSQTLLSREELKAIYTIAITRVERQKARVHIRGFLRDYGRNLSREASGSTLELQAAKFVQELAGRIADEITWKIIGFEALPRSPKSRLEKKDLETWLSSLESQHDGIKDEPDLSGLRAVADDVFETGESEDELDNDLLFPNIDKVKEFLLNSEALQTHIAAMKSWLKIG